MADQITRWESLSSALSLRDAMDRLFEDSIIWPRSFVNRDVAHRLNTLLTLHLPKADEVRPKKIQVRGK